MGSAISWEIVRVRGMHYMSEACTAAASSISHISSYRRAPPRLSVPLGLGSSVARMMGYIYIAGACSGHTFVAVAVTVISVVIVVVAVVVVIVVAATTAVVIFIATMWPATPPRCGW